MFRITKDPSSGSLALCLAKNYKNDSIVSVWNGQVRSYGSIFWPVVCVCSPLNGVPPYTVNYKHTQRVRIRCHNTDHVHVNGHDRIILVVFTQALYKFPWWWILCDPKHVGALLNFCDFNCIYIPKEVGCGYMDWIGLAQARDMWRTLVSAVMNLRVQWNVGNFLTSYKPVSCSRRALHHGVSK